MASVRGPVIGTDQLDLPNEAVAAKTSEREVSLDGKTIDEVVQEVERRMVQEALKKFNGNKQRTAQALGLSRQGLGKKLKRLGIA